MNIKLFWAKFLRIPRCLRKIYYIRFNRFKFWLNDVSFGSNMQVYNKIYLNKARGSKITIGDNFIFSSGEAFNPLCRNIRGCMFTAYSSSRITIGDNSGISSACFWANTSITIGNHVKIGGDCLIMDTDAHNLDHLIRRLHDLTSEGYSVDGVSAATVGIVIEDDVLIGTRCIILKGVTIGARSVIGSGSVVTKSIPSDSIAAGNPCRVIRTSG